MSSVSNGYLTYLIAQRSRLEFFLPTFLRVLDVVDDAPRRSVASVGQYYYQLEPLWSGHMHGLRKRTSGSHDLDTPSLTPS